MKAPCAHLETWQCQSCGHRLIDHAPRRDSTPSAPRVYIDPGSCSVPGCACDEAVTAYFDAAARAVCETVGAFFRSAA